MDKLAAQKSLLSTVDLLHRKNLELHEVETKVIDKQDYLNTADLRLEKIKDEYEVILTKKASQVDEYEQILRSQVDFTEKLIKKTKENCKNLEKEAKSKLEKAEKLEEKAMAETERLKDWQEALSQKKNNLDMYSNQLQEAVKQLKNA